MSERIQVAVRLTRTGLARIDEYAEGEERTRSDMIRKLLSEAIQAREAKRGRT